MFNSRHLVTSTVTNQTTTTATSWQNSSWELDPFAAWPNTWDETVELPVGEKEGMMNVKDSATISLATQERYPSSWLELIVTSVPETFFTTLPRNLAWLAPHLKATVTV